MLFLGPPLEQRMRRRLHARRGRTQHAQDLPRIRPRREHAFLRPPQLRRRHELHRARDLLRALHRADAAPVIEKCGHRILMSCALQSAAVAAAACGAHGRLEALLEMHRAPCMASGSQRVVERLLFAQRVQQAAVVGLEKRIQLGSNRRHSATRRSSRYRFAPAKIIITCFSTGSG